LGRGLNAELRAEHVGVGAGAVHGAGGQKENWENPNRKEKLEQVRESRKDLPGGVSFEGEQRQNEE